MRSDIAEVNLRLDWLRKGALLGGLLGLTNLGGFWDDYFWLQQQGQILPVQGVVLGMHTLAWMVWGGFAGLWASFWKRPGAGSWDWKPSPPKFEPAPESLRPLPQRLGWVGLVFLAFCLIPVSQVRLWQVGAWLPLWWMLRAYRRWEVTAAGRMYVVSTFFGMQWFQDLKVLLPQSGSSHPLPTTPAHRKGGELRRVGPRSDEVPYARRMGRANRLAWAIYLVALVFFSWVCWQEKGEVFFSLPFLALAYSLWPYWWVSRRLAFRFSPSGVTNKALQLPQTLTRESLTFELVTLRKGISGCSLGLGCLALFTGFGWLLLVLPFLPLAYLVEQCSGTFSGPAAAFLYLPWVALLWSRGAPVRRFLEIDPHSLKAVEHRLQGEYQFSQPGDLQVVALGLENLHGDKFLPVVYLSNGLGRPLAGQPMSFAAAQALVQPQAQKMLLPVIPAHHSREKVREWIHTQTLLSNLAEEWPLPPMSERAESPGSRPPLD